MGPLRFRLTVSEADASPQASFIDSPLEDDHLRPSAYYLIIALMLGHPQLSRVELYGDVRATHYFCLI